MSVAYYIVLDTEEPAFDTFVNGKHLAHEEGIDELCRRLEIRTFDDYLSMSADEIADLLDDDIELPEGEDERWFSPEEGLTWATTLAAHIRANPDSVTEPEGCLEDLAEYIEVLEKTRSIGAQWHLNIDI
ncbi:hypothetical protein [Derxia gummosa]|uniref:Uncharacterized protein n=1 Tax=Derxia gummosa DSM 723 TaxID=1121388 RepID=A0A9U5CFI8_9BURK|nr:hypothetical protein [Derxia gummosa]